MNVTCKNCRRSFDLDESRLAGISALLCDCGHKLVLTGKSDEMQLGKYLLLHKIATGGMGEIFYGKVTGIEGFEREVAIKKMLPHLNTDRSFVEMMVKEAKLTVLLNHPNIVQIYDLSRDGEQYYIAMEYVPGVTIANILRDRITAKAPLPVAFCVHATLEIVRGLHYAANLRTQSGESLSIVHRDITPQNILVTKRGMVKITDFGIAKAANEITTTSPGMIKGKMGYMAPEQLSGKEPDHRIDLFCAAIMLWEMLAGKRLFKGSTEVDTFRMVAEAHVPDLRQLRSDVDARLMEVVQKALHVDRDARYQQGSEFAEALQQAIFPHTADSYARETEAWLTANGHMFADVYVPHEDATTRNPLPEAAIEPVTKFTRMVHIEQRPSRALRYGLGLGIAAGVALVGAGIGWRIVGAPAGDAPVAVQSQITPAPVTETPAAAPTAAAAPAQPVPAAAGATAPATPTPTPAQGSDAAPADNDKQRVERRERAQARAAAKLAKKALTGGEIQSAIAAHQGAIVRCLRALSAGERPAQIAAKVLIETSGQVSEVKIEPPLPEPQLSCLQAALREVRLRRHPTEGLEVTIPLRLQAL